MKEIDIAMTAVLRPKILKGTLETIVKNVVDWPERFRLVINIDPVGQDVDPQVMVKVCKQYFDRVVYNIADVPSFPNAVKWVWSKTRAPYVFHWEDDVNILRHIDVANMIKILQKHKKLASLRLYSKTARGRAMHTFKAKWFYNDEGFYLANDWKAQFGLNPTLIKQDFIKEAVTRMVEHVNPEKQFRVSQSYMRPLIQKWQYGLYANPGETRLIDGRKGQRWKDKLGIDKPKGTTFLHWVKK